MFFWQETGLVHLATDIHSRVLIKSPTHVIQIIAARQGPTLAGLFSFLCGSNTYIL